MVAATTRQGAEATPTAQPIYDPPPPMGATMLGSSTASASTPRFGVHNGVENYWSLLKRTHPHLPPCQTTLHRYRGTLVPLQPPQPARHRQDERSRRGDGGSVADLPGVDRLPRLTRSVGDMTDPEPTAEQPLVTVEQLERATDALLAAAPKSSTEGSGVGGGVPSPNPPLGG